MHELAICQALIDQVKGIARSHGASRITGIQLAIGPLSGVEAELLRRAYPLACHGTLAENAGLIIEYGSVRVRCSICGSETETNANHLVCAVCGDWHTQVVQGDELLLLSVEVEKVGTNRAVA